MIINLETERQKRNPSRKVLVLCGSCKTTGLAHAWNEYAERALITPTRACPYCNGKGRWYAAPGITPCE